MSNILLYSKGKCNIVVQVIYCQSLSLYANAHTNENLKEILNKLNELLVKNKKPNDSSNDKENNKGEYRLLIEESYKHVLNSIALEKQLVGLAFSGGGIRSATFNLGVLQGMAELGILRIFNYLSTVSGGGYIGSWLIAWIKKEGKKGNGDNRRNKKNSNTTGLDAVIEKLKPDWNKHDNKEPEEIHRLRDYSNYLTPRKGLFGTDTWLLLTTYLRNSFFNLLILVSFLLSIITSINLVLISVYHPSSLIHDCIEIERTHKQKVSL